MLDSRVFAVEIYTNQVYALIGNARPKCSTLIAIDRTAIEHYTDLNDCRVTLPTNVFRESMCSQCSGASACNSHVDICWMQDSTSERKPQKPNHQALLGGFRKSEVAVTFAKLTWLQKLLRNQLYFRARH